MAVSYKSIALFLISLTLVVSFIFLRISLVLLYPVIVLGLFYVLNLRLTQTHLILILLFVIMGLLSSFLEGLYFSNFFFSEYLICPLFIFLISKVKKKKAYSDTYFFDYFVKIATLVLVIVNISAFVYAQFIIDTGLHNYEDAFTGLYGRAGFGSHSLSIVNLGFSVYFLFRKNYLKFLFFLFCGVMGYYGLGLMVFLIALFLVYFTQILRYWRTVIILLVVSAGVLWFINQFNSRNLDYIKKNLKQTMLVFEEYNYDDELEKAKQMKITEIPRFLIFLDGSRQRIYRSPKVAFLGTSPGGYNSRTAFYLNGDFVQNKFLRDNFKNRTEYHQTDIFPLLNRELIKRPFNDGTRNQTFSSIVSVLMEYGLPLGLLFFWILFKKIRSISRKEKDPGKRGYLKFLIIFLFLMLFVQNYLEYPEIIFPFILIIKLVEVDHINNALSDSSI